MSRTYKDKPYRLKHEPWDKDRICVPLDESQGFKWYAYIYGKSTKTKKRKEVDTEDHWMTTPGWWIRLMMGRPQRREGSLWEREVVKTPLEDLDGVDTPSISRKPHIYYW